jgi:hypothetical protein
MAGTMSMADLVADFKRSLHDSVNVFADNPGAALDADFERLLRLALVDMSWKRSITRLGQVTLVADEPRYSLAEYPDFATYKTHLWEKPAAYPNAWEPGYPGAVPRVTAGRDGSVSWLLFDPAPSSQHIALRGETFKFYYFGQHVIDTLAANTTVAAADRGLLILRAQAEAMLELTLRNMAKPVQLRDGISGTPRNSTPAALHETLLRMFQEAK